MQIGCVYMDRGWAGLRKGSPITPAPTGPRAGGTPTLRIQRRLGHSKTGRGKPRLNWLVARVSFAKAAASRRTPRMNQPSFDHA